MAKVFACGKSEPSAERCAPCGAGFIVRAEARTYPRSKDKDKGKSKGKGNSNSKGKGKY